jgi:hypothetical protein
MIIAMDQVLGLIDDDGFGIDQGWRPSRLSKYESHDAKFALLGKSPPPPPSLPPPQQKMLFRAEIRQLARVEFQEALRELEETREKRARKLVEEALRRAVDRGSSPLPKFAKMVDVSSSYCTGFQRYATRLCKRFNPMRYIFFIIVLLFFDLPIAVP